MLTRPGGWRSSEIQKNELEKIRRIRRKCCIALANLK
jgi:hypothetical protein